MDLTTAIRLACDAHHGQVDKGGAPYILHPLRLLVQMTTPEARVVAVLHDVLEDSDTDYRDLWALGMTDVEYAALRALYRHRKTPYDVYIQQVATNALAVEVKLADLRDNMQTSRLGRSLTPEDEHRQQRYAAALAFLSTL